MALCYIIKKPSKGACNLATNGELADPNPEMNQAGLDNFEFLVCGLPDQILIIRTYYFLYTFQGVPGAKTSQIKPLSKRC